MIKICAVYFEGKYKPEYVSKLYRSLKRNSTVDFQFICLSDTKDIEADVILPYNHHSEIKLHWHKLKFFSPQFAYQNPDDEIIIMDIDQVIVNNIDEMLTWPVGENEIVTYHKWWNNKHFNKSFLVASFNGGWYKFKSGSLKHVWDEFAKSPEHWQLYYYNKGYVHYKYYGEQNYVYDILQRKQSKITYMPAKWVGKYTNDNKINRDYNLLYSKLFNEDYMILDEPSESLKIVHFANPNANIHDSKEDWLKNYWK